MYLCHSNARAKILSKFVSLMKKLNILLILCLVIFQYVSYAAESFRFALFTDLHISTTNPIASEDLKNAVNDVNSLSGIDFVIVSGDVSNLGDTTSLKDAKRMLKALKMPFYIVPGNHDFHWNIGNGAADFIRIFGDDKFVFVHKGFVFAGFSTVPLKKTGSGYIQSADIEWLKSTLQKQGNEKPSIIITHYPLLTGDVDNWKEMKDVLHEFNVITILNGHYHRKMLLNYDGIPGIVNRSTLRAKEQVGGYSLYTVSDSIKVSEKRIGEPAMEWLALPLKF